VSERPIGVLCVDDDPGVLELTATCIERESGRISVTTETTAEDALERVADGDVDCVVSDYQMPKTDGLALLSSVRALRPDLPFVLFTGRGSEAVASEAVSAGVTDYLRKDGTDQYRLLAKRIENAVDRWRAERGLERRSAAMDALEDGIAILDEAGRYVEVNGAYAGAFGADPDTLVGDHWSTSTPAVEAVRLRRVALSTIDRGSRWSGAVAGVRGDGPTFVRRLRLVALDEGYLCVTTPLEEPAGGPLRPRGDTPPSGVRPDDGSEDGRRDDPDTRELRTELATARDRIESALDAGAGAGNGNGEEADRHLVEALDALDRAEAALRPAATVGPTPAEGAGAGGRGSLTAVARAAWDAAGLGDGPAELTVDDCLLAAPTRIGHVLELLLCRLPAGGGNAPTAGTGAATDSASGSDPGPADSLPAFGEVNRVDVAPTDGGIRVALSGAGEAPSEPVEPVDRESGSPDGPGGALLGDLVDVMDVHGWRAELGRTDAELRVDVRPKPDPAIDR